MNHKDEICNNIWSKLKPYANCKKWHNFELNHIKDVIYDDLCDYCSIILHNNTFDDLDTIVTNDFKNCVPKSYINSYNIGQFIKYVKSFIFYQIGYLPHNYGKIKDEERQYIYKCKNGNLYLYRYHDRIMSSFNLNHTKRKATYYSKYDIRLYYDVLYDFISFISFDWNNKFNNIMNDDYIPSNFINVDIRNYKKLFINHTFYHKTFKAEFNNCNFNGAKFINCDFDYLKLHNCDFSNAKFIDCTFNVIKYWLCNIDSNTEKLFNVI